MEINNLVNGIIIGFSASVPLGPIGVLCIQKTINKGRLSGFISGLGAATSDMVYAIIAGFGLSFVTAFIIEQQLYLRIAAGIILFYLGFRIFFSNPGREMRKQARKKGRGLAGDFISLFLLTFSNPLTVFFFLGAFAAFGVVKGESSFLSILILTVGVFLGAAFWWSILTTIVNIFRKKFRLKSIWWINKIAGIIVIGFAIFAIISIFLISEGYVNDNLP